MPGAWPHPQPRVRNKKAHEIVTTGPPQRAGIPCANGFNGLLRALPGESGFLATIADGSSRQLDASVEASGPHDFAVRKAAPFVVRQGSRPPHPAPTSVTIAIRPSLRARDGFGYAADLGERRRKLFLRRGLDR